jgi:hypothetical protein
MRALFIDNGRWVRLDGERKFVGSAHYSGDEHGNGTVTLCFTDGSEWSGPADTEAVVETGPLSFVESPCVGSHDIGESATKCGVCGVVLCDLCQSDEHFVGEGHDLNNPRYWGV